MLVVGADAVELILFRNFWVRARSKRWAPNGGACLEQLKSTTLDCMVLDLSLPDASGFSLLETTQPGGDLCVPASHCLHRQRHGADEELQLRRYSKSIIIKGAKSPERLLDEVTLFLHQVVAELPAEQRGMMESARAATRRWKAGAF